MFHYKNIALLSFSVDRGKWSGWMTQANADFKGTPTQFVAI